MSKIVRHRTYKICEGEGEAQTVRLKKWSAAKLFFITREFWGLIEDGLSQISDLSKLSEAKIIAIVVEQLLKSEDQAARMIKVSIDDPNDLSEAAILEWDADDFIGVLSEVVEMNVNEEFVKNFRKLLGNLLRKKEETLKSVKPQRVVRQEATSTA